MTVTLFRGTPDGDDRPRGPLGHVTPAVGVGDPPRLHNYRHPPVLPPGGVLHLSRSPRRTCPKPRPRHPVATDQRWRKPSRPPACPQRETVQVQTGGGWLDKVAHLSPGSSGSQPSELSASPVFGQVARGGPPQGGSHRNPGAYECCLPWKWIFAHVTKGLETIPD